MARKIAVPNEPPMERKNGFSGMPLYEDKTNDEEINVEDPSPLHVQFASENEELEELPVT